MEIPDSGRDGGHYSLSLHCSDCVQTASAADDQYRAARGAHARRRENTLRHSGRAIRSAVLII